MARFGKGGAVTDTSPSDTQSIPELATDAFQLAKSYAKQELVDPLASLKKFLMWGVPGMLLMGLGVSFLLLAGLRALQDELPRFGWYGNNVTWLPYLLVLVVGGALAGLVASRINAKGKEQR
jgi:hypothetical protein